MYVAVCEGFVPKSACAVGCIDGFWGEFHAKWIIHIAGTNFLGSAVTYKQKERRLLHK